jgi:type IV pilus assembly protein PilY1
LGISTGGDDVNQDGSGLATSDSTVWTGVGVSTTLSYTGLRFGGVSIPKGAVISSARLKVYSAQSQWLLLNMTVAGDLAGNSVAFSSSKKPGSRTLTTAKVVHSSNISWSANTWYTLPEELAPVIQEIVNLSDWTSGNSMSLIIKGSGSAYARKFFKSFEGGGANYSAKLVITYAK